MADSYIQLPADSTGKKVDTFELTVGANTVHRGGYRITGELADEVASVSNAIAGATEYGMAVRLAPPFSAYADPQTSHVKSVALAPGGVTRLESGQVSAGKTGYPIAFVLSSTVPWQAQLQLATDGTYSADQMVWTSEDPTLPEIPRGVFTVTYSAVVGLDGWSIRVTNQGHATADFYGTFFWDEI